MIWTTLSCCATPPGQGVGPVCCGPRPLWSPHPPQSWLDFETELSGTYVWRMVCIHVQWPIRAVLLSNYLHLPFTTCDTQSSYTSNICCLTSKFLHCQFMLLPNCIALLSSLNKVVHVYTCSLPPFDRCELTMQLLLHVHTCNYIPLPP